MKNMKYEKLMEIKKQLEELTQEGVDITEAKEALQKIILKEQKPKRILLKANEQIER